MGLTVRHVTPGLGALPRDSSTDACSGLVGAAIGIARAQVNQGHRAQVLGWNPGPGSRAWEIDGIEAYATPAWQWARVRNYDFRVIAPMLALTTRRGHADIMHAYVDPHLLLSPRAGVRLLHMQTPVPEQASGSYRWLVNRADGVVCCSEFIRSQFLERIDFPESRTFVVTNGVDPSRFEHGDGAALRRDLGIEPDTPVILFAGAITPEKGLLDLLRAASRLYLERNLHILVAGSAALWALPGSEHDEEDQYTRLVRHAAAGLPVTWLGSVPSAAMPDVYAAADVFVCPSAWDEPFGMVACEAMAAGKPVIASMRGGLPEIVVDGETGFLVPSEHPAALGAALDRLLADPVRAAEMGRNARVRSRNFSWSQIADQLEGIYAELGCPPRVQASRLSGKRIA
jgi:glycosyltransferase involved in cell wall biosynthesis